MNKEQFIQAYQEQLEKKELENLEREISNGKRLQKDLAKIGIESVVNESGHVFIAGEYRFSSGYTSYSRSTYWLHKGDQRHDLYHNRIEASIIASIGEAMIVLDKPVEQKETPKYTYAFSGNSLGEILEQVMREMVYEQVQS